MSQFRFRGGGSRWSGRGVVLLGALLLGPQPLQGQIGGDCDVPNHNGFRSISLSNGSRITYFSFPTIVCAGNTRISADSAVVYESTNYTQLYHHVVFLDADSRLTADQAHYFGDERRLRAWGRVILNDLTQGSIIRGDTMIMLRAGPGRPEDELTVRGTRPHATLYPTPQPLPEEPGPMEGAEAVPGEPADSAGAVPPDSVVVVSPDSAAAPPPVPSPQARPPAPQPSERTPYEIRARRMYLEGSRYFRASGNVTINRDSLDAVADSVEYDEDAGTFLLSRDASLTTTAYELTAATILLDIPQDEIRSVLARHDALLEGESLWLLAPTISLGLTEGRMEHLTALQAPQADSAVAEPEGGDPNTPVAGRRRMPPREVQDMGLEAFPERPHAFAEDFLLWADSIEVLAPDEVLEEVWAMGAAHGESLARDSLNTADTEPIAERDWLEGDTIVAIFVPNADSAAVEVDSLSGIEVVYPPSGGGEGPEGAQADSARYRLDRVIARVDARTLYRMAATDSTVVEEEGRLAIHYVLGDEITIFMNEGEVDRMEVAGETRGIHLEPLATSQRRIPPDTTELAPDSAGIRPDTTLVRPDTSGVRPDTSGVRPDTTVVPLGATLVFPDTTLVLRRRNPGGRR